MDRNKLFKINFIVQAVLTTISQIIKIVQQTKKKKDEKTNDQEWRIVRDILMYYDGSTLFLSSGYYWFNIFLNRYGLLELRAIDWIFSQIGSNIFINKTPFTTMQLSKKGADYLKKCNRTEFLALLEIYQIKHLFEESDMMYSLAMALAFYINKTSVDSEEGLRELNMAVQCLVSDLNRFNSDPKNFYVFANQILKAMGLQWHQMFT